MHDACEKSGFVLLIIIIGFTETWLRDDECDLYMIPGYRMVEKHRADRIGGGVAICIKDDIDFTERYHLVIFNRKCQTYVYIKWKYWSTM